MMSPTVIRGFSEVYGSCITIWMLRRARRSSRAAEPGHVLAAAPRSSPTVGRSSPMSSLASVDLPQPDSPTMPSVSPRRRSRLTPSTARTAPICVLKTMPAGQREVLDQVAGLQHDAHSSAMHLLPEVARARPGAARPSYSGGGGSARQTSRT